MDYNKVQSCQIISSTNRLPQMHATHVAGSSMKPTEFVNHGLLLWNQGRRKWTRNKKTVSRILRWRVLKLRTLSLCIARKYCLRSYRTYESLLSSNRRFPKPIPLGEMVGYLVDTWEQGGMYD